MARPKSVPATKSIEALLNNKIEKIKSEIERLNVELQQTLVIKADYDKNRTTIETILGLQSAPDLSQPNPTARKTKAPRLT